MDAQAVTSLISTVGFPIVCCIYMAYLIKDMNDKHADEMNTLRDTLSKNTTALEKLELLISELRTDIKTAGKGSAVQESKEGED